MDVRLEPERDELFEAMRAQALAKVERGHPRDPLDVAAMLERRLVAAADLRSAVTQIEADPRRFPAIDRDGFRRRLGAALSAA